MQATEFKNRKVMKKWIIGCGVTLLLSLVTVTGLGYLGYVKLSDWNSNRKAKVKAQQTLVESGVAQRRKYLEAHLSQETRDVIPAEFYTYAGFRDWWRLPLVFPYQLMCIDTRECASLEMIDSQYSVKDPNNSSIVDVGEITGIATDNVILLFERQTEAVSSYGMLQYESGARSDFENEEQLWAAAQKAGYSGKKILISIDELFTAYYNFEESFVE